MVKVKFKKIHPDAVLPTYAKPGDAGMDLVAVECEMHEKHNLAIYRFGLAVEIPDGHVGLIFSRSSIFRKDLMLSNCVGVIDSGYRGEISVVFRTLKKYPFNVLAYKPGERIAQLIIIPIPKIEPVWVDRLSDTERGTGGFGSTGG